MPKKSGEKHATPEMHDAAFELYCIGYELQDIAATLSKSYGTVSKWSRAHEWPRRKAERAQTLNNLDLRLANLLDHQLRAIEMDIEGQKKEGQIYPIDKEQVNSLARLAQQVEKLMNRDNISTCAFVFEKFLNWLKLAHPESVKDFATHSQEFIREKAEGKLA